MRFLLPLCFTNCDTLSHLNITLMALINCGSLLPTGLFIVEDRECISLFSHSVSLDNTFCSLTCAPSNFIEEGFIYSLLLVRSINARFEISPWMPLTAHFRWSLSEWGSLAGAFSVNRRGRERGLRWEGAEWRQMSDVSCQEYVRGPLGVWGCKRPLANLKMLNSNWCQLRSCVYVCI